MLTLDVTDYRRVSSWHAALRDNHGTLLASHDVRLDERSAEFELLVDLYRGLWRLDVDPARRDASAKVLIARVGAYVTKHVLGDVARALAARAPLPVVLRLPPDAVQLSAVPLEIAMVGGRTLVEAGVVFAHQVTLSRAPSAPQPRPDDGQLRVLGVFALPEGVSALALVRERRALTALLRGLASQRQVDAHILQYGATRDALELALADPRGWDVVHLSGHGAPGGLQFEDEEGRRQRVDRQQLVEMFRPCVGRISLITASSCESGAVRALRRRPSAQGQPHARALAETQRAPSVLPSLGHELHAAIGCSVLAMRFPVDDRFSVLFASTWYESLLLDGTTTGEALARALRTATPRRGLSLVSAVTPVLLGDPALKLSRAAPLGPPEPTQRTPGTPRRPEASAPPTPPELFVGRGTFLDRLRRLLSGSDGMDGPVLIVGGPGVGKTSSVAEAVEWCRDDVDVVHWQRVTRRTTAASLHKALQPLLGQLSDTRQAVVVLDGMEALLSDGGGWRSAETARVVTELCRAVGPRLRVALVGDRLVQPMPEGATVLAVGSLSRSESEWLARECQELAWGELGDEALLPHVGLTWLVCRGHPRLIEYCSERSGRLAVARTRTMDAAWEVTSPTPAPDEPRGRPVLGTRHPGGWLTTWASDRAKALTPVAQLLFSVLSSLEASDRHPEVLDTLWPALLEATEGSAVSFDLAVRPLMDRGLVEVSGQAFWIHPAVARAGRDLHRPLELLTIAAADHLWGQHYTHLFAETDGPNQHYRGHVAASRVPYLMRLGRWEEASARSEEAINHNNSPAMASRLLPFLREIVLATHGTPLGRQTRYVRYIVLDKLNPSGALHGLEALYAEAAAQGDALVSLACASAIVGMSHRSEPLEALNWLQRAQRASTSATVGPWALLLLRLHEAQVFLQLDAADEALHHAKGVLVELKRLQAAGVTPSGVNPHTLEAGVLDTAAWAASNLGDRAQEQEFRRRAVEAAAGEGTATRGLAELQFNQVQELIRTGRLDEAQEILVAARAHFQNPGDEGELGLVLIALAGLQHTRGHDGDAVELGRQALRSSYAAAEWLDAARSHQRLATFLAGRRESAPEAPVQLLAAAVIRFRSAADLAALRQSPQLLKSIGLLQLWLSKHPTDVPQSIEELAAELKASSGLDLESFLAASKRIPAHRNSSGQLILTLGPELPTKGDSVTDVLTLAHEPPMPEALLDPQGHPKQWSAIVEHAADARSTGVAGIADLCDDLISAGWGELAAAVNAIAGGVRAMPASVERGTPEHQIITWILELIAARDGLHQR